MLPGGRAALITAASASNASINGDHGDVLLADIRSQRTTVLVHSAYAARYVPDGHLIFARGGSLFAVRFDASRGAVEGNPVAIASGVSMESAFGMLQASAARGVLAYVPGGDNSRGNGVGRSARRRHLYRRAGDDVRRGRPRARRPAHRGAHIRRPDYLWIWNLGRHEGQRVAYAEAEGFPRWSADGRRLAGIALGRSRVVIHDVDRAGHVGEGTLLPDSALGLDYFSPNGDVLAVGRSSSPFRTGFVALRAGAPKALPIAGNLVTFSPDGKWLAYTRAERGHPEVFIRAFPDGRDVGQVSQGGGIEARWNRLARCTFATAIAGSRRR